MISSVQLKNYRSYQDASFEFEEGVNIIIGPNASGKTNLIEALILSVTGKNFRGKDEDVIKSGQDWAKTTVFIGSVERSLRIKGAEQTKKEFEINKQKFLRLPKKYIQPIVIFEPNHLYLLHGSPEARRDYIDKIVADQVIGHKTLVNSYKRALSQRNALLKLKPSTGSLFVWDIKLTELGLKVYENRKRYVEISNDLISGVYSKLAGKKSDLILDYLSSCSGRYADNMMKLLEKNRSQDIERGFTSVGPHRDDIQFTLNKKKASQSASRGEVRTILLTMKVVELKTIEENSGKIPIFMLDDVFSELDGGRRRALTDYMDKYQTFITTTDADVILHNFSQEANSVVL